MFGFETMGLAGASALLAEIMIKGAVLLVAVLAALRTSGGGTAALRHRVLVLGTAALLGLPLVALLVPEWSAAELPVLDGSLLTVPERTPGMIIAPPPAPVSEAPAFSLVSGTVSSGSPGAPRSWPLAVWALGAAWVLARLVQGHGRIRRIVATAADADPALGRELAAASGRLGLHLPPRLLVHEDVAVPFTWGVFRPCIVLPADAAAWPLARLECVLLHELAHVRRRDGWANLLSQLSVAIHWFNPLAWLVRARLVDQQEQASDDLVLATGVRATDYAGCLVDFAGAVRVGRGLPVTVAMAGRSRLDARVRAILGHTDERTRPRRRAGWPALAVTMATLVFLAGYPLFAQDADSAASVPATPDEQSLLVATLDAFHEALVEGRDYDDVRRRFLTRDYFDDADLTLENWSTGHRDRVLGNTVRRLGRIARADLENAQDLYRAEILDCRRQGADFVLTQRVNIGPAEDTSASTMIRDLEQTVIFTGRDGDLRIKRYDGGIHIGRMDVDNPHGPIFIVTLAGHEITHPGGPMLFKSVPRSGVSGVRNPIPLD